MTVRNALLGACLALPLAVYAGSAVAEPPAGIQTIAVPPGAIVLILPSAAAQMAPPEVTADALSGGDPLLRVVAEQDAMTRGMMAEMNAAFTQPLWPMQMDQAIRAAFGGLPASGTGAGVVITGMSGGTGTCSERVTYVYPANGAEPQVTITRSGDACGALGMTAPRDVTEPVPAERPEPPTAVQPNARRLWTVGDPPHEVVTTGAPRT